MKRLFFVLLVIAGLISAPVLFGGEIATLPSSINLHEPTTNQVELISQTHYYGASPFCVIRYNVIDSNGSVIAQESVLVDGADYTTFVSGYGGTMKSNGNAKIWADIQTKYTLVE
jgi:hypothetical protein